MQTIAPTAALGRAGGETVSAGLMLLLAAAAGLIAANIYYTQPLIGPISASLGLAPSAAGLIVTVTQIGFGTGLLMIVPLGDIIENRRLVLTMLGALTVALTAAAFMTSAALFLVAAGCIGLCAVTVQILLPYAAHLAPEATRGRVVGNIMSGLMLGIMLARPVASFITDFFGWHAVFGTSALAMVGLAIVLRLAMPPRQPSGAQSYGALLGSLGGLLLRTPVLQRRALYHAFLFGTFSLFWTTVPLLLSGVFHLSQSGIALFALAGVAGVVSAPIAGYVADRGHSRPATGLAMATVAISFGISRFGDTGSVISLGLLVASAILLDFGMTANLVLGQRAIFSLGPAVRSRLNGLYMAIFFCGGAIGSAVGGWAYAQGGWGLTAWIGLALPVAALGCWVTERG